jgi:hypothetical protein
VAAPRFRHCSCLLLLEHRPAKAPAIAGISAGLGIDKARHSSQEGCHLQKFSVAPCLIPNMRTKKDVTSLVNLECGLRMSTLPGRSCQCVYTVLGDQRGHVPRYHSPEWGLSARQAPHSQHQGPIAGGTWSAAGAMCYGKPVFFLESGRFGFPHPRLNALSPPVTHRRAGALNFTPLSPVAHFCPRLIFFLEPIFFSRPASVCPQIALRHVLSGLEGTHPPHRLHTGSGRDLCHILERLQEAQGW